MKHTPTLAARLLAALAAISVAAGTPACAQSSPPRGVVAVSEFERGLKRIEVEVDGVSARVIIDTGAGITGVGPDLADKIGCTPFGQLSGVRMTGEVLTAPWCGPAVIKAGGVESKDYLMYFDVASLLPPDWPHVDGIMSLNAFMDGPITLDWPGNRIILESRPHWPSVPPACQLAPPHPADVAGYSVSVFMEVAAEPRPLRVLLDAGSVGSNILAPSAFAQLGSRCPARLGDGVRRNDNGRPDGCRRAAEGRQLQSQEIIYDGTFGAAFLSENIVTLDFEPARLGRAPDGQPSRPPVPRQLRAPSSLGSRRTVLFGATAAGPPGDQDETQDLNSDCAVGGLFCALMLAHPARRSQAPCPVPRQTRPQSRRVGHARAGGVRRDRARQLGRRCRREPHRGDDVTPASIFRLFSITKTIVAATAFTLIDEGRIGLDDPIGKWLDTSLIGDLPHHDVLTVRHLIAQTSGIRDYDDDRFVAMIREDMTHTWKPEELVAHAADGEAFAPPGDARSYYSNTNYTLLGLIIEKASGMPLVEAVHARVLEPLGAAHTYFWEETDRPQTVAGYYDEDGDLLDVSALNPSLIWRQAVSCLPPRTPPDWSAGFSRATRSRPRRALMTNDFRPLNERPIEYGYGSFRAPQWNPAPVGHSGEGPGGDAIAMLWPDDGTVVVVLTNLENGRTSGRWRNRRSVGK